MRVFTCESQQKATDWSFWKTFNNKNGEEIKIQCKNNLKINRKNLRLIFAHLCV